jgi:lipid II:glycine glycyltransferase (peptidoglycan interpeptide bridge formation enzyme)
VLASHQGRVVAGAIYFHYGKKAIFKYGASDKEYQNLRANNLVMWEAVKEYCLNGYDTLSLGRTETNNTGLRQFKAGWGAEENTIPYYRYDFKKKSFAKGRSHVTAHYNKVFSRIPIPLLKIIGTMFYRHAG